MCIYVYIYIHIYINIVNYIYINKIYIYMYTNIFIYYMYYIYVFVYTYIYIFVHYVYNFALMFSSVNMNCVLKYEKMNCCYCMLLPGMLHLLVDGCVIIVNGSFEDCFLMRQCSVCCSVFCYHNVFHISFKEDAQQSDFWLLYSDYSTMNHFT